MKPDISKKATKFLQGRLVKHQKQIVQKILELCQNPLPSDSIKINKTLRRATCGEYRIIYYVDGNYLRIPTIGKRNDGEVYRGL